jgi:uncharacterized protein (DUF2141 family)
LTPKDFSLYAVLATVVLCRPATLAEIAQGQTTERCALRLHVDGLRNANGVVGAAIYSSPEGWPEGASKALRRWPTPIAAGERQVTAVSLDLPPGDYGVVVIHDENKNQKLDRNIFGWPKEGFGFANNPRIRLGAPSFKEALIHVACPATDITIHIQYK